MDHKQHRSTKPWLLRVARYLSIYKYTPPGCILYIALAWTSISPDVACTNVFIHVSRVPTVAYVASTSTTPTRQGRYRRIRSTTLPVEQCLKCVGWLKYLCLVGVACLPRSTTPPPNRHQPLLRAACIFKDSAPSSMT